MLRGQPVEEHAVRDLAGEATHLGTERRYDEPRRELAPQLADSGPQALERLGVRAADPEEQTIERKHRGLHALDDALRSPGVERDHADAELDALGLARRVGERGEPVGRAGMVHPEGAIAEALGLARARADDFGRGAGEHRESKSHHRSPLELRAVAIDAAQYTPAELS
jgi:hypothetical protein